MNKILLALALALVPVAAAAAQKPFRSVLYERYCEKLREGAHEYVHFVQRLRPIHGYTYTDFAPEYPGAPVKADCRAGAARVAAVQALVASAAR